MKKIIIYTALAFIATTFTSCESIVDGINIDPNHIGVNDIDPGLYINTPELGLVEELRGMNGRMAALWTGQIIGTNNFPLAYYNYQVTESTFDFGGYHSVITQCKHIQDAAPRNKLYQGLTRVLEAYLFGTYASLYGDVPATEVATDIDYPKFESQKSVLAYSQRLLDEAIEYFKAENAPSYKQDYLLGGNVKRWIENTYTLKARFYTLTKEYDKAYDCALQGVSSDANSMYFVPVNDASKNNKNNWYTYSLNQFFGTQDLEGKQSFLFDVLDKRRNSKTDETARKAFYFIDPTNAEPNHGIASSLQKEPLITYAENLLILAETGSRTKGFSTGLKYLNQLRQFYQQGGSVNEFYASYPHKYENYDNSDFENGGLLNSDNLTPIRALLREIILERYISGFTTFTPWDDARRLRGSGESDIAVDIPLNNSTVSAQPERFYYPETEMLSNPKAPADPGIFAPTEINKK